MTGWIVMAALALAVLAGLWRWVRREPGGLQFVGAALLLALAGYAWQGRPGFAGAPKAAQPEAPHPKSEFAELRTSLLGPPDASTPVLAAVEPYLALGDTERAVDMLREAIAASPRDYKLWLGLADALVQHGEGRLSPAAELAYRRAMELAPDSPLPTFFFAVTLAHEGQFDAADGMLQRISATGDQQLRDVIGIIRQNIAQLRSGMAGPGAPGS